MATRARVAQLAEAIDSKSIKCGFESRPGHGRLHAQGGDENASNAPRMAELIAFLPTLCALSLVVFGLGGHQPTAPLVLWTIAGAIMGGPVAVNLFGFVGWLVMVLAGTVACTAYAAGRRRPLQHLDHQR